MAADEQNDLNDPQEPAPELKSPRARKFLRLFLIATGGLAAPSLALAAFFLSSSGESDPPAAKSGVVQSGRVTTTTTRVKPAAPVTTTTTTAPSPPVGPPPRDPFQPLMVQAPAAKPPAR